MNPCVDVEQPYEGQKFTSFDTLKKYLEEYGQKNFVKFWIRSSHTRNSFKSRISKTMNPELKYVSIKFACIFGGEKIRCRGSGIRKSSTYRNLGCPCMINAVVGEDGNHVKLDSVVLEHNHVLCKTLYDSLKKMKKNNQFKTKNQPENLMTEIYKNVEISSNVNGYSYNTVGVNFGNDESNIETKMVSCGDHKLNYRTFSDDIIDKNFSSQIFNSKNNESTTGLMENGSRKKIFNCKNVKGETRASDLEIEVCRLCLSSKNKLSPIFSPEYPLRSTVLSFKIMGCASIDINSDDGLPNNICSRCEAHLDVAYSFRLRCENSDSILRNVHEKSIQLRKAQSSTSCFDKIIEGEMQVTDNFKRNLDDCRRITVGTENMNSSFSFQGIDGEKSVNSCFFSHSNFETREAMADQLELHSNDKNFVVECNTSSNIHPTMKDFRKLMSCHLKESTSNLYVCEFCQLKFVSPEELSFHENSHSQTKNSSNVSYLCNVCGKILKSKDRFLSHKNTHEGLRPHVCLKCGKGFADRKNMHQHYDVVHLRKSKHECPICQKKFYTRTKMKSHITMHYGLKPFACDVCSKTFRLKMNMIKHKKTHSNDRPYHCDKCNAAFIDKNMLKRHSYTHGGIRPYPCPTCGHRFSFRFHLKKHLEKSKCKINSENCRWTGMTQTTPNFSENKCVVVISDANALQFDSESIGIDILKEYNE